MLSSMDGESLRKIKLFYHLGEMSWQSLKLSPANHQMLEEKWVRMTSYRSNRPIFYSILKYLAISSSVTQSDGFHIKLVACVFIFILLLVVHRVHRCDCRSIIFILAIFNFY